MSMADGNITLYVTTQKAQEELARMLAENAALKRDLQYARDGLTKGRTRMREDNERMKSALQRLADWGGLPGCDHYSGTIAADVMAWVRGGMAGPLPPLPEWAQGMGPNDEVEPRRQASARTQG